MSEDTFRIVLVIIIISFPVALLCVFADIMMKHPSIPWFISGIAALAVAEGIGYLVYRIIKQIRKQ